MLHLIFQNCDFYSFDSHSNGCESKAWVCSARQTKNCPSLNGDNQNDEINRLLWTSHGTPIKKNFTECKRLIKHKSQRGPGTHTANNTLHPTILRALQVLPLIDLHVIPRLAKNNAKHASHRAPSCETACLHSAPSLMAFNGHFILLFSFSSEYIKHSPHLICFIEALCPLRLLSETYFFCSSSLQLITANWCRQSVNGIFCYVYGNNYFTLHLFKSDTERGTVLPLFSIPFTGSRSVTELMLKFHCWFLKL